MTAFERELQSLKPYDEVQSTSDRHGYPFIGTAGHGYLVVPKSSPLFKNAEGICEYGYVGHLAVYLEEDSEAPLFLRKYGYVIA